MFIDAQTPLGMQNFLVLEFFNQNLCGKIMSNLNLSKEDCIDSSSVNEFDNQVPADHAFLENHSLKITLDPATGNIAQILQKEEEIILDIQQKFMLYEGKQSHSGLYIFNPKIAAHDIQDLKIIKTFIVDGHLMRCIQVMSQVTRFKDLVFINKVCLHNDGL